MNQPDVWIVQKKTALERYTKRALNVDFFDYLERAGQSLDGLVHAHNEHNKSRDRLLKHLEVLGISAEIFTLDELAASAKDFYSSEKPESGLHPARGLVLALGGDGTLLHASHYVGNDVWLAGVNSCPEHSVGHLCDILPNDIERKISMLLARSVEPTLVRRLKTVSSRGHVLPLALNDVLLTNRHPAATSRYQLSISSTAVGNDTGTKNTEKKSEERTEKQLSSGLWVAAPAGTTAAISSYGLPPLPLDSSCFQFAVREPYMPSIQSAAAQPLHLLKEKLEGNSTTLTLFSRMRQGIVCVDGPDSSAYLGFGESVELSLPPQAALKLVLKFPG